MKKGMKEFLQSLLNDVCKKEVKYESIDISSRYGEAISLFENRFKDISGKTSVEILSDFILLQAYDEEDKHYIGLNDLQGSLESGQAIVSKYKISKKVISGDSSTVTFYHKVGDIEYVAYYIFLYKEDFFCVDVSAFQEMGLDIKHINNIQRFEKDNSLIIYIDGITNDDNKISYRLEIKDDVIIYDDIQLQINQFKEDIFAHNDNIINIFNLNQEDDFVFNGPLDENCIIVDLRKNISDEEMKKLIDEKKVDFNEKIPAKIIINIEKGIIERYIPAGFIIVNSDKNIIVFIAPDDRLYYSSRQKPEELLLFNDDPEVVLLPIEGTDKHIKVYREEDEFKCLLSTFENGDLVWEEFYLKDIPNRMIVSEKNGMLTTIYTDNATYYRVLVYFYEDTDLYRYSHITLNAPKEKQNEILDILEQNIKKTEDSLDPEYELFYWHNVLDNYYKQTITTTTPTGNEVELISLKSNILVNITQNYSITKDCNELVIGTNSKFVFMKSTDNNTYCTYRSKQNINNKKDIDERILDALVKKN